MPVSAAKAAQLARDAAAERKRKRLLKSLGICTTCGQQDARPNRNMCSDCATKHAAIDAKRRARRKAKDACTDCGKPRGDSHTVRCTNCTKRHNRTQRRVDRSKQIDWLPDAID